MTDFRNRIVGSGTEAPDQLLANPANWRIHPKHQQDALEAVLNDVGWVQNIIVNQRTGHVVDGHLRVALALRRNESSVPVVYVDLSEAEENLILATIDPVSALAGTDAQKLDELLHAVNTDSAALQQMLTDLATDAGLTYGEKAEPAQDPGAQIDRAEELREKWQTERGQLWTIPSKSGSGEHRLLCGDSTNADDVARVMAGEKADCVFTDPPYNIASENSVIAADVSKSMMGLKNADWDKNFNLQPALERISDVISQDVTVYVCTSHHLASVVWSWMGSWATHHSWCVWEKPNPMPSLMKRHWTWNAELVAYATRGKHVFNFPNEGHAPSIWRFNKHKETDHPTEKPLEVPAHAISHSTNKSMFIYDPFGGSGTTMVACEQLARQCRMIEIEPKYCGVILERMSGMGLEPRLVE